MLNAAQKLFQQSVHERVFWRAKALLRLPALGLLAATCSCCLLSSLLGGALQTQAPKCIFTCIGEAECCKTCWESWCLAGGAAAGAGGCGGGGSDGNVLKWTRSPVSVPALERTSFSWSHADGISAAACEASMCARILTLMQLVPLQACWLAS